MAKQNSSNQSSSKKIQQAARAAASSRGSRERRELVFPLVLAVVIILGTAMVVLARLSRPPDLPPDIGHHWHAAYGIYDCGHFVEYFLSRSDPDGIHSHQDGVIHIHPWNSSATGEDARFDVFFDAMGARVTKEEISGPGIGVIKAGSDCAGEPTVIRVARFILPDDVDRLAVLRDGDSLNDKYILSEEFTDDFHDIRLLANLESFTIARVPVDAEIPPPPETQLRIAFDASLGGLESVDIESTGPITAFDSNEGEGLPIGIDPEIFQFIETDPEEVPDGDDSGGDEPGEDLIGPVIIGDDPDDDSGDEPPDGTSSDDGTSSGDGTSSDDETSLDDETSPDGG